MSIFVVDYKEQFKKLVEETYQDADMLSKEFQYTTDDLISRFSKVMPYNALDDHLVFEALSELGFTPKEDPEEPLSFYWYFKRK